ncbi:MAG: PAS domain S-box protein, partial [Acidobacteriota bacterium]|nr:PAS domain S-box protein [Acidobacteriota bacterium]
MAPSLLIGYYLIVEKLPACGYPCFVPSPENTDPHLLIRARSQQKPVDEALAQSEERTRLIIETALDAVVTMDDEGLITGWNARAEKMFGWSREEALGR